MAADKKYSLGDRVLFWLVSQVLARVVRLMFSTCRVELLTPELDLEWFASGRQFIGVTWHRTAIFFLYYFGPKKAAIMISRSRDGEFLAGYTSTMGCVPVRGSSQHGGSEALRTMEELLRSGAVTQAATVADGPRGPRYVAKRGMISLARRTGLPLVPLMWSSGQTWVFKKAWDRTMFPKPFARIKLMMGKPFYFPPEMSSEQTAEACEQLSDELNRLKDHLDKLCGYRDPD